MQAYKKILCDWLLDFSLNIVSFHEMYQLNLNNLNLKHERV